MYKVYTSGVWDLFHVGHLNMIKRAATYGDYLIVGVATDEAATRYKRKPVIPFEQRCEIISAIRCVDEVVPVYYLGTIDPMVGHDVNVRVAGGDFGKYPEQWEAKRNMEKLDIRLVVIPRTPNVSTTDIMQRIREDNEN